MLNTWLYRNQREIQQVSLERSYGIGKPLPVTSKLERKRLKKRKAYIERALMGAKR